jgi:diguanylate cyclase (GGDEF)-like protein
MGKPNQTLSDAELLHLVQEVEALRLELKSMGQRLAEAERLADRDVLTPLLNRRAFLREVQRAIAMCRRHNTPASLIYFDMDSFKAINDRFGHAGGDAALVTVAERLRAEVREADVVGRIGGDEFAVLLQHADQKAATAKAASLLAVVTAAPAISEDREILLRLTYGVREISAADSAEQALAEADAAMYVHKPAKG